MPSIALKVLTLHFSSFDNDFQIQDIPVQREQLRLKLCYGSKKVTTFNADLSQKQVSYAFKSFFKEMKNL